MNIIFVTSWCGVKKYFCNLDNDNVCPRPPQIVANTKKIQNPINSLRLRSTFIKVVQAQSIKWNWDWVWHFFKSRFQKLPFPSKMCVRVCLPLTSIQNQRVFIFYWLNEFPEWDRPPNEKYAIDFNWTFPDRDIFKWSNVESDYSVGRKPWSSGYGRRLMFEMSRVWISMQYTGWEWHFFIWICCKKCIVCLKRPKINKKEAVVGPFLKFFVVIGGDSSKGCR